MLIKFKEQLHGGITKKVRKHSNMSAYGHVVINGKIAPIVGRVCMD